MSAIGGYFELELRKGEHYHKGAIRLNTARNSFEYVLRARGYKKVYMPYYTCDVMFQPLNKLGVEYILYHIDDSFEICNLPNLNDGEAILYTNYFALKQSYIEILANTYGSKLIVDNAQAFYAPRIDGIDTFYSARKFFGVPDGAYLYTDCYLQDEFEQDISLERMNHLFKRIELGAEAGYADFRKAEKSLDNQPIKRMSKLTEEILGSIDYSTIAKKRVENYTFLNRHLCKRNCINLEFDNKCVPMIYPFLSNDERIRRMLLNSKVYVAKYWKSVLDDCEVSEIERRLVEDILPLIIDQRYELDSMTKIITLIKDISKY